MALQKNEILSLELTGFSAQGGAVGRWEGEAVFVPLGAPGDMARVKIVKAAKTHAFGKLLEVLRPSPARVEPDCPYFGRCGGCQLRHMTYAEELEVKRRRVEDALRRIGGTQLPVPVIHGAENILRYRNKVQFPVAQGAVGYYQGGTHQVVDIADCLLQTDMRTGDHGKGRFYNYRIYL